MGNLNRIQIIGRLGQDPEKKVLQSGSVVTNISVAVSEKWKDQSGQLQERTEWFRVNFWGKTAENVDTLCVKGSQVYVEGSMQTREWTDKDGNKRQTPEVKGYVFQILSDGRPKDQAYQQPPQVYQQPPQVYQQPPQSYAPAPPPPPQQGGQRYQQPLQHGYQNQQNPTYQQAFDADVPPPVPNRPNFVEDDIPY